MDFKLNTIEEAIEDIKAGKVIIVVDDEDRENEGDFVTAARNATPEIINFMATHGRGLVCAPLTRERCEELQLELMVGKNTAVYETNFTVSVDLQGYGCTTGISASDRSKTIKALIDPNIDPVELGRPGHIFPLIAKDGGVLRRTGHTEATVDLARLAGFEPAGVLVEILKEDGEMARLPELMEVAKRFDLKIISIEDLIEYRLKHDSLIVEEVKVDMPTAFGDFKLKAYTQKDTGEHHLALYKGEWNEDEPILVRVHSSCLTGDIFGSCRCDCGPQLHKAMEMIQQEGKGVIVYMNQEGRGIGLVNKLQAYKLQETGVDTVDANIQLGFKADLRDYGVGAQILRSLGVTKMRLMSNNPSKRAGLVGYGLEIVENVAIEIKSNPFNEVYLKTKRDRMGHTIMKNL
ncbi:MULTISPECIES: bifunctional 3,4-dihydroxy-2-butanone-4-phosphate synthase/GTP cyclohydrolase II [Sphingobacterium]|jgi:3,4-dihydroxy 2-butanone 4-phosphate synthase/GTP cyclohydrolase II|uniref:bifunctional 3,4-dihydroxy-2-butanone-4-phosphate synthase/GTP cyclohydrolase II n=1 Tax=Sphingobacterium TaxID=28453 RepID=UPI0004E5F1CF|nr:MULTISPECIES: bifunctional 3,4-dihydroxy-2-butanone-4-phosphate synthase/GTP cyclohydrolase II [Sphingobacterium]CDS99394.1 Riboflavin biosynthesis protein RibBA (Includes: 3,4-dihydroxy-2-butanone 4-phosphate synthase; GTP cyclohydrolase-2) [Sphingobacterium sp. PM2-P1-29]SJN17412.1 3,4-dihydroxy-2-butanone 4-phosphate synthase / GTP cyclohydrolase II [Sphingobacterium faecium PCAi_F2.5]HCU45772.1 bifunctional 3,4-dihydroxy-2-butanone-4-phosphate synthase/GTP cyclohydrolase II [Sphingobacter